MKQIIQNIGSLLLIFLLVGMQGLPAQIDQALLIDLNEQEEEAINALVLYPNDTRLAILDAAMHPEALVKLENIQYNSRNAFQNIIARYPQNTQEVIWDLTRYPGLIETLVGLKGASTRELNQALKEYPDIIHERARSGFYNYHWELQQVHRLNMDAEVAFSNLLVQYPGKTQRALQQLIELPEVLGILTDNIRLTLLIGDLYKKDPRWVLHKVDSLNLVVARQQAEELDDWKKSLGNDPQALQELQESANSFGEEHGYYYDDYYEQSYDDVYYEGEKPREIHNYHYYNYPYWFGYPSWYDYPRWRMYPHWYEWGFYYSSGRTTVVIGMPSFYFTNWYFYHPYHHYRWSYLSAHFTRHYYSHRRHGSSITAGVTVWQSRNRAVVSNEFMRDDSRLQQRFREFGKFEADRARYNRSHPKKEMDQVTFRQRNPDRYRELTNTPERQRTIKAGEERIRIPTDVKRQPQPKVTKPRVVIPRKRTEPTKKVKPPRSKIPAVKKGTEQHRSISERTKSSRTRIIKPTPPKTKAPAKVNRTRTVKKKTTVPRKKKN